MKKEFSKKLWIGTILVCGLYISILLFSRIDSIQKKNDGKIGVEVNAAYECPTGYIEIADFCIQSSLQGTENWHDAVKDCAENEEARLCKSHELMAACQAEDKDGESFNDDIDGGGWEWSADTADDDKATVMFRNDNDCKNTKLRDMTSSSNDYRCCKNRY